MKISKKSKGQAGQALVTLLIFTVIAMSIASTATILIINSSTTTSRLETSTLAYQVAESGAENALLRLLRDPSYAGETLTIGEGVATIVVSGTNPKIIISSGRVGNFIRRVQVVADYSSILTINSWREIF